MGDVVKCVVTSWTKPKQASETAHVHYRPRVSLIDIFQLRHPYTLRQPFSVSKALTLAALLFDHLRPASQAGSCDVAVIIIIVPATRTSDQDQRPATSNEQPAMGGMGHIKMVCSNAFLPLASQNFPFFYAQLFSILASTQSIHKLPPTFLFQLVPT